jgi:hypothetical protein
MATQNRPIENEPEPDPTVRDDFEESTDVEEEPDNDNL